MKPYANARNLKQHTEIASNTFSTRYPAYMDPAAAKRLLVESRERRSAFLALRNRQLGDCQWGAL